MKWHRAYGIGLAVLAFGILMTIHQPTAYADQAEFCHGFSEGYKSIKGGNANVPYCPYKPYTPYGSTDFREGIKAGQRAARSRR